MHDSSTQQITFQAFEHAGWEKAVAPYHYYFGDLTNQTISALLEVVHVQRGTRVLDVATGPGYVAARAAQVGAIAIGIDFSETMVAQARRLYPAVEFREGNSEALPFPAGSFDAVLCNFGLLHFSRPENALAEAYRVLGSGGRVAFTVWAQPEVAVGFGMILQAIQTYGTMDAPLPPGPPFFRFSDAQECSESLQRAGFASPSVEQLPLVWEVPSPAALFDAFFEGTVRSGALLRAQSSDALPAIRYAIEQAAKPYEKDGRVLLPMPAVLASAVKPSIERQLLT
jgi:ubiquinone/menaquinone biosynthesis C-methylase UbiE